MVIAAMNSLSPPRPSTPHAESLKTDLPMEGRHSRKLRPHYGSFTTAACSAFKSDAPEGILAVQKLIKTQTQVRVCAFPVRFITASINLWDDGKVEDQRRQGLDSSRTRGNGGYCHRLDPAIPFHRRHPGRCDFRHADGHGFRRCRSFGPPPCTGCSTAFSHHLSGGGNVRPDCRDRWFAAGERNHPDRWGDVSLVHVRLRFKCSDRSSIE